MCGSVAKDEGSLGFAIWVGYVPIFSWDLGVVVFLSISKSYVKISCLLRFTIDGSWVLCDLCQMRRNVCWVFTVQVKQFSPPCLRAGLRCKAHMFNAFRHYTTVSNFASVLTVHSCETGNCLEVSENVLVISVVFLIFSLFSWLLWQRPSCSIILFIHPVMAADHS